MQIVNSQTNVKRILLYIVFVLLVSAFGYRQASKKISFLEFSEYGGVEKVINIDDSKSGEITQEIPIPFELISGISILATAYNKDINSDWSVVLRELDSEDDLYSWTFNASRIKEGEYLDFEFKNSIRLNSEKKYEIVICPRTELHGQKVGVFCNSDNQLRMRIYGGTNDVFWLRLCILLDILLILIVIRVYGLREKRVPLYLDDVMCMLALIAGYFVMMYIFARPGTPCFSDEYDNIYGGLAIAKGATIYKDYISQHTPLAYCICAVFAKFGAHSVEQFRLLNYLSLAVVWGIIYLLYAKSIGRKKMFVLPFVQLLALRAIWAWESVQILSDNYQIVALTVLILEFACYYKDRHIDIKRMVIVSLSVFVSFGMAFLSVYAIAIIVCGVAFLEYRIFSHQKVSVRFLIRRYVSLLVICMIPFVVAFLILYRKGALVMAYEMAYKFNSDVYPYYIGNGFGTNKLQPFIIGICSFFEIYCRNIVSIIQAQCSVATIVQVIVQTMFVVVLYKVYRKDSKFLSVTLFLTACMCVTRGGGDFHSLVFWGVLLLVLVMYGEYIITRRYAVVAAIFGVCIAGEYFGTVKAYAFCEQPAISNWEYVAITSTDVNADIVIDGLWYDATYLIYKGRTPKNSMMFFLPWYMDWYEDKVYNEIEESKPALVIYNPESEIWNNTHFYNRIEEYITNHYERVMEGLPVYKKVN